MKLDHDHDEVPRNRMLLCIFHWIPYVCWFIMVHSPRTAAWIPIPWSSSMWFPLKLWHILPEMMRWSLWSSFFGRHTCHKSGKTMSIARHPPWSIPGGGSRGLRKKLLTMDQLPAVDVAPERSESSSAEGQCLDDDFWPWRVVVVN